MPYKKEVGGLFFVCLTVTLLCTVFLYAQIEEDFTTLKHFQEQPIEKKDEPKKPEDKIIKPKPVTSKPSVNTDTTSKTKKTLIYLEQTDLLQFDEYLHPGAQLLIGNVIMRHDSAYLFCDTAYFYQNQNTFHAFGRVKMVQGDTLSAFSDKLYYDGDTKIAKLRHNVHLVNGEVNLYTDSLNYNRNTNVGYYFKGGRLQDSLNTLNSERGYYYSNTKMAEFKLNVKAVNEDFVMDSDTLKYDTDTKIAIILGPTFIYYQKETTIYSELGFYNTDNQKSHLKKNSYVAQSDGKILKGDTIFYDKLAGFGEAYNHVEIIDTSNNIALLGNYGFYVEEGERGFVTDSAVMIEYSSTDTLYVNADTLYSFAQDTNKVVLAYHNVRVFRDDVQAVCDSMTFTTVDTILNLMNFPVMWTNDNQITGDTIRFFMKNEDLDRIHIINNAFVAQQEDTLYYNQLSGKEIFCYVKDSALSRVDVLGNAESIYFPKDSTSLLGMNEIKSTYMNVHFNDGQIDRLVVYPTPTAKMLSLSTLKKDQLYLLNFTWVDYLRPKKKEDIFLRPKISKMIEDRESNKEAIIKMERDKKEKERKEKMKTRDQNEKSF